MKISENGVNSGIQVKKSRLRHRKFYMKNCKLTTTRVKRHIAGKHLSRSFASWLPFAEEKSMSSINWSLKSNLYFCLWEEAPAHFKKML